MSARQKLSGWRAVVGRVGRTGMLAALTVVTAPAWDSGSRAAAQFLGFPRGVVGGVQIDAHGVVSDLTAEVKAGQLAGMRERFAGGQGNFAEAADRRLISLKGLQAAIADSVRTGRDLPEEVLFLGGMTRVEYVMLYPEQNDIVIGGPAEPWQVSLSGSVVGTVSGRPVLYLDDLLAAFRTVERARQEGISCSIDPTQAGSVRLNQLLGQIGQLPQGADLRHLEPALREAFGPQLVTLTGLPTDSHMAQVLVAADYQMKRHGMGLHPEPIAGLPSYLQLVSRKAPKQLQSRFWMACDYDPLQHSADRLAWRISGPGIKTLTEQEAIADNGGRTQTGKVDPSAKKWVDGFTSQLDQLSRRETVFGELRNVMDLCVVAALIAGHDLERTSGCSLEVLRGSGDSLPLAQLGSPQVLPPQCSFVKTSNQWVVSASGGVMVDSWSVVQHTERASQLDDLRAEVALDTGSANSWLIQ